MIKCVYKFTYIFIASYFLVGLENRIQRATKKFFDELAKEKGFHPTKEPEKWADVFHFDILERKVILLC